MKEPRDQVYLTGLREKMEDLERQAKILSHSLRKARRTLNRVKKEYTGVWKSNRTKDSLREEMNILEGQVSTLSVKHTVSRGCLAHIRQQVIELASPTSCLSPSKAKRR